MVLKSYLLARRCMLLRIMKNIQKRLKATWFWQIFGVCAMQKTWTKFLVAVALVALFPMAMSGLELLTPIYRLDGMHKTDGVLLLAKQPARNIYGSRVVIRKDNGEKAYYWGAIRGGREEDALKAALGKRITVWSQIQYDIRPPFVYEHFWHIQESGGTILIDYDTWYSGRLKGASSIDPAIFKFSLFMFTLSLIVVAVACQLIKDRVEL